MLAFAPDRDRSAENWAGGNARPGQLSDRHLRSAFSHHLGQLPRPVRLLWSIVCATLQGTRKQGRLGSADLENCLLGVHLSRSYLVKFVSLLLAYHPLGPTTFWVRPPVLSICVAFNVHLSTCASKYYLPLTGKVQRDARAPKGPQGLW